MEQMDEIERYRQLDMRQMEEIIADYEDWEETQASPHLSHGRMTTGEATAQQEFREGTSIPTVAKTRNDNSGDAAAPYQGSGHG